MFGQNIKGFNKYNILVVALTVSREVVFFGLTLVGAGISQLFGSFMTYWPLSLVIAYVGVGVVLTGLLITVLGLLWKWGPWKHPLGVSLLAVGYVLVGLFIMVLGGWIFTPLFLLGFVFFIIAWAILTPKKWGKFIVEILAIIGFALSFLGVGNDGVVNVSGVLGAFYMLWYVNRPHVARYFGVSEWNISLSRRDVLMISFFALILLLPITLFYLAPPSRSTTDWMGGNGGGTSNANYVFHYGDIVIYSFHVDNGSAVEFSIQLDSPRFTIVTAQGYSGSGEASVPYPGQYTVWVEPLDTVSTVHFEIAVKMLSVRAHLSQWALLDIYAVSGLLLTTLQKKRNSERDKDDAPVQ